MRRRPPSKLPKWAQNARLPIVLIVAGLVALFVINGLLGGRVEQTETRAEVAEVQRDEAAQNVQDLAAPQAALCRAGGEAARTLDAAGLCERADQALQNPVVQSHSEGLSPAQIDDIVQRVLALTPQPPSTDAIVNEVLARLSSDPELRGLNEADVRTIVATAIASLPDPEPGRDGQDGQPGVSFGGLTFGRDGGQCVAVVTFVDPDGSTRTERTPVGEGACAPADPPDPPVTDPPDPPVTEDPPPPVTEEPPPPPVTEEPPPPVTEQPPPPPTDGGGLLNE